MRQQRINLLNSLPQAIIDYTGGEFLLKYLAALLAAIILFSTYTWWESYSLNSSIASLTAQRKKADELIADAKKHPEFINMLSLEKENAFIEKKIELKNKLIDILGNEKDYNTKGFSQYMTALGFAIIDGMWLTDITITNEGKRIYLRGKTKSSAFVSRFIENMKDVDSLSKYKFSIDSIKGTDFSIEGELSA